MSSYEWHGRRPAQRSGQSRTLLWVAAVISASPSPQAWAESKGSLSVGSREARSSPEPRTLSQVFCPRVSGGFGIDSTLWGCLCSDLVGCQSCVDTAAIPGWSFTILPGIPLTSLLLALLYPYLLILDFFLSFC